jgi:hypothetical protein
MSEQEFLLNGKKPLRFNVEDQFANKHMRSATVKRIQIRLRRSGTELPQKRSILKALTGEAILERI